MRNVVPGKQVTSKFYGFRKICLVKFRIKNVKLQFLKVVNLYIYIYIYILVYFSNSSSLTIGRGDLDTVV